METSPITVGRKNRRSLAIVGFAAVLAIAASGYWYWTQGPDPAHAARPARPAVPVSVATASRQDVPIYLTGLGTVQALFTVAIHAQVDGKLQEVLFTGRPARPQGRRAGQDRSAALPGRARSGQGQEGAGRSPADRRAEGSRTLQDAGGARISRPSRMSISSRPRSTSSRPRSTPTRPPSRPRRPISTTPTIVAPSDGRMGVRMVDPGNIVHADDQAPIATLTQTAADRGAVHAAGALARRRARRHGARPGRGRRLRPATTRACSAPARCHRSTT